MEDRWPPGSVLGIVTTGSELSTAAGAEGHSSLSSSHWESSGTPGYLISCQRVFPFIALVLVLDRKGMLSTRRGFCSCILIA